MKLVKSLCFLTLCLLLTACNDPKEANKENFKKALLAYWEEALPQKYVNVELPYIDSDERVSKLDKLLDILEKEGLVSSEMVTKNITRTTMFGDKKTQEITGREYTLTDKGKEQFVPEDNSGFFSKSAGFQFGKLGKLTVLNFSEPSPAFGMTISEVQYTYTVTDIPDWAKNPELLELIPSLKDVINSTNTPITEKDVLILTNDGWIHEKLYKK